MPGLTICLSLDPIGAQRRAELRKAASLLLHQPRYSTTIIAEQEHADVRFTAYKQYPRWDFDSDDLHIFVEGIIYNKPESQVRTELGVLGRILLSDRADALALAKRWVLDNDGEYIVVVFNKSTGEIALLTDVLCRLPLFYQKQPGGMLISREPKYIIKAANNKRLDPIGVAEFLMHGYNMGDRTMSEGIKRLDPATLVRFSPRRNSIEIHCVHRWLVGSEIDDTLSLVESADLVVDRFCEATRSRVEGMRGQHIALGLSGGLDSRAVALALHRERLEFSSYTCLDHDRGNIKDVEMARRVAKLLGCAWKQYQLGDIVADDALKLVSYQEGGSTVGAAVALQYFRRIAADHGEDTLVFSGDGGGNVMYPLQASGDVRSVDDILRRTYDTVYYWDINRITRLLHVDTDSVRDAYRAVFEQYPESDPQWKYGHFKLVGRPYRFIMEGEDRTRYYYWLGAPFWALPVVRSLTRVPESHKADYRLFRAVLHRMHAKSNQIPYTAVLFNVPFGLLPAYALANRFIKSHPVLYRFLRTMLIRRKTPDYAITGLDQRLRRVIRESPIVAAHFDVKELTRLYDAGLPRMNYLLLATVLLKIDLMDRDFREG